jgi:hypothetical protein
LAPTADDEGIAALLPIGVPGPSTKSGYGERAHFRNIEPFELDGRRHTVADQRIHDLEEHVEAD